MSSISHAPASDVFASSPFTPRRRASREAVYAVLAIAFLFLVLAAVALAQMSSVPLAGEEGADVVSLQPFVTD